METLDPSKLTDREILILLQERQAVMGGDVKELKEGTNKEIASLQLEMSHVKEQKADKVKVDQLERGQQRLFNYIWGAFGALAIIEIAIPVLMSVLIHK